MILVWNTEGSRRKGKPREQWINGVRRRMIAKISQKNMQRVENCGGATFLWN